MAGEGWGRYRGAPPYYAYGKPLWTDWCNHTRNCFGEHRLRSELSFAKETATLIQRVMRGALARKRIKNYGSGPLPLKLLSSRVVIKTDMGLQQSRSILPRGGNDIIDYLERELETEMKVDGTRVVK